MGGRKGVTRSNSPLLRDALVFPKQTSTFTPAPPGINRKHQEPRFARHVQGLEGAMLKEAEPLQDPIVQLLRQGLGTARSPHFPCKHQLVPGPGGTTGKPAGSGCCPQRQEDLMDRRQLLPCACHSSWKTQGLASSPALPAVTGSTWPQSPLPKGGGLQSRTRHASRWGNDAKAEARQPAVQCRQTTTHFLRHTTAALLCSTAQSLDDLPATNTFGHGMQGFH